jgi:hypothetical protein
VRTVAHRSYRRRKGRTALVGRISQYTMRENTHVALLAYQSSLIYVTQTTCIVMHAIPGLL